MTKPHTMAEKILTTALRLAESNSWEAVRLYDVSEALGIGLNEIRKYYREKEDLAEALFDQADDNMLRMAESKEFLKLTGPQRLHKLMMAWLNTLDAHKRVVRQIIFGKLEPGHLHIQIPALMRISRTVQWMREAARRPATFLHRAFEETGLTTIYLMTFLYWIYDDSPNTWNTSRFLERRLARAANLSHYFATCLGLCASHFTSSISKK